MISNRIKKIMDFLTYCLCVLLKYNPFRHEGGIYKFGNAGPDSPVFVSGDYFQTVKKIMKVLEGRDCYLLVVDSAGINVWCGAGVGDFNEHKIADAVNACGLSEVVNHRKLILPQLSAVGINKKNLKKECGFSGTWGPANLYDIPAYIDNDLKVTEQMRIVKFSNQDIVDQVISLFAIFSLPVLIFSMFGWSGYKGYILYTLAVMMVNIGGVLAYERIKFIRYPSNKAIFIGFLSAIPVLFLGTFMTTIQSHFIFCMMTILIVSLFLAFDMVGSTPHFKTTMMYWLKNFSNQSLFQPQINGSCAGCGECVRVCPKGVLVMENKELHLAAGAECCECLACVKQCSSDSISNRNEDYKHDIKSIPNLDLLLQSQFGK